MLPRLVLAVGLLCACGTHSVHTLRDVKITAPTIVGPRRGPIILRWTLDDPDKVVKSVRLERSSRSGWVPATVSTVEQTGTSALVIWESFADVSTDGAVKVRLVAVEQRTEASTELSIDVWNDPETERLILSGHDLVDTGDGGASGDGTNVAVMAWSGATQGLTGTPINVTVGKGAHDLRASPNGRASVVLEDKAGTLSVLFTPLNAHPGEVRVIGAMAPPGSVADVHWSPDGRYLYAVTYAVDQTPASIWRWEPTEDLSSVGPGMIVGSLPGPPGSFAVDRATGHLVVACGPGNTTGVEKITVHDKDGVELAKLEQDMGGHQVAIHPLGGYALIVPDGFFGMDIHRLRFTDTSIVEEGEPITTVQSPWEAVFHPLSTQTGGSVLISNQEKNTVTSLQLTATGQTVGTPVGRVPLASEMDLIERGTQTGTIFITAVTEIYRVELSLDGTTVNKGSVYNFGMNTEDILSGIAVQR